MNIISRVFNIFISTKDLEKDIQNRVTTILATAHQLNLPKTINPLYANKELERSVWSVNKDIKKIERNGRLTRHQKVELHKVKRVLLALQLGGKITAEMLERNPTYEKFILDQRWNHIAPRYNHVLPVIAGIPGVILDGNTIGLESLDRSKKYSITQKGLVQYAPAQWKTLIAHEQDDPTKWGNQYAVEVVTSVKDPHEHHPLLVGDHSWLRLKTPEGLIYSWGVYGPVFKLRNNLRSMFRLIVGATNECPDRYETVSKNENFFHETCIGISQEEFQVLMSEIKKLNEKGIPYSLYSKNCTGHVKRILSKIGIKINHHFTPYEALRNKFFSKKTIQLGERFIPKFVRKIFGIYVNTLFGIMVFIGQGSKSSSKVTEIYGSEFTPDIRSINDIFFGIKGEHPLALRQWQKEVDSWRKAEIDKVQQNKQALLQQKSQLGAFEEEKRQSIDVSISQQDASIKQLQFSIPKHDKR